MGDGCGGMERIFAGWLRLRAGLAMCGRKDKLEPSRVVFWCVGRGGETADRTSDGSRTIDIDIDSVLGFGEPGPRR